LLAGLSVGLDEILAEFGDLLFRIRKVVGRNGLAEGVIRHLGSVMADYAYANPPYGLREVD
jgi:hypothetical protein